MEQCENSNIAIALSLIGAVKWLVKCQMVMTVTTWPETITIINEETSMILTILYGDLFDYTSRETIVYRIF